MKYVLICLASMILLVFLYMKVNNMTVADLYLSLRSSIKKLSGNAVKIDKMNTSQSQILDHEEWTKLLSQYVTEEGVVNYKGFLTSENQLNHYLELLSENPPKPSWDNSYKMAYWINAYNAFTVKLILTHYPLASIKDITKGQSVTTSPWDLKFFKIGGIDFDLNTIEHEILRKEFNDPRIHFAINCASFSCPRIRTEAFQGELLDDQLDDQSRYFLLNKTKNIFGSTNSQVTPLFSWFESDFTKHGTIQEFIGRYVPDYNPSLPIEYMDYNWTLNE